MLTLNTCQALLTAFEQDTATLHATIATIADTSQRDLLQALMAGDATAYPALEHILAPYITPNRFTLQSINRVNNQYQVLLFDTKAREPVIVHQPTLLRAQLVAQLACAYRSLRDHHTPSWPITGQVFWRASTQEWVLELTGAINDTHFTSRHTQPGTIAPEDVPGLPEHYALVERIATLEAALEPFASLADMLVDEEGWSGLEQRAAIYTWMGPSDFRNAKKALNPAQ